jgi:hypothetical protein
MQVLPFDECRLIHAHQLLHSGPQVHAVANGRRTKNFIPVIKFGDELITDQARKEEVFS